MAGSPVKSLAQLVEHLPLQVINADSFELLTGSPAARRQYLDWGVFRGTSLPEQWQRFQRCIKQRNKLLRHGKIRDQELAVWTRDLASSGEATGDYRRNYFKLLAPVSRPSRDSCCQLWPTGWVALSPGLGPAVHISNLRWRPAFPSDMEQGYTHVGPQRADIRVLIDGRLAAETLSRGQQKLVVWAEARSGQLMAEYGKAVVLTWWMICPPNSTRTTVARSVSYYRNESPGIYYL